MDLHITVSDEQFKEIIDKELAALKPEEIHDVIIEAFKTYFTENKYAVEHLLFGQTRTSYDVDKPSEFTKAVIESCDFSELQPEVDKSIELLKGRFNSILKSLILDSMTKTICDSYGFQQSIRNTISQMHWEADQQSRGFNY